MKTKSLMRIALLVLALAGGVTLVRAQDPAIRARMEQRLGSIDSLKDRKLVGENNRGFLEARAALTPPDEKVVSDENADRAAVYAAIAAQAGASADQVGRARAQKIAITSKRGVWIQAPDGNWFEKS